MSELNTLLARIQVDEPKIVDKQSTMMYVPIGSIDNAGLVKPNGTQFSVDADGTLHINEEYVTQVKKISHNFTKKGDTIITFEMNAGRDFSVLVRKGDIGLSYLMLLAPLTFDDDPIKQTYECKISDFNREPELEEQLNVYGTYEGKYYLVNCKIIEINEEDESVKFIAYDKIRLTGQTGPRGVSIKDVEVVPYAVDASGGNQYVLEVTLHDDEKEKDDQDTVVIAGSFTAPRGTDGKSFEIKVHVDSADELPTPTIDLLGTAYSVGITKPFDIYIVESVNGKVQWLNYGPFQGEIGLPALTVSANVSSYETSTISITKFNRTPEVNDLFTAMFINEKNKTCMGTFKITKVNGSTATYERLNYNIIHGNDGADVGTIIYKVISPRYAYFNDGDEIPVELINIPEGVRDPKVGDWLLTFKSEYMGQIMAVSINDNDRRYAKYELGNVVKLKGSDVGHYAEATVIEREFQYDDTTLTYQYITAEIPEFSGTQVVLKVNGTLTLDRVSLDINDISATAVYSGLYDLRPYITYGDICTFVFDGKYWQLISVNKQAVDSSNNRRSLVTVVLPIFYVASYVPLTLKYITHRMESVSDAITGGFNEFLKVYEWIFLRMREQTPISVSLGTLSMIDLSDSRYTTRHKLNQLHTLRKITSVTSDGFSYEYVVGGSTSTAIGTDSIPVKTDGYIYVTVEDI